MDFHPQSRPGRGGTLKPWHLFAAVILVLLGLFLLFTPGGSTSLSQIGVTVSKSTTAAIGNLCAAALPVQFTVIDALAGSAVNAPTMVIYQGILQQESPTVSSSGVATTGGSYNTGTNLVIKLSGAGLATEYLPFTVPPITCGSNQSNNIVKIYAITLGAWTITAAGQGGTTFTSGNQYFVSQLPGGSTGTSTVTFTFSESTSNAGYKTSTDIINSLVQNFVVQIKDTGTALSISGLPRQINVGTTRYWFVNCADGIATGSGYGTNGAYAVSTTGATVDSVGSTTTNPATGVTLQYPSSGVDGICVGSATQQKVGNNVYGGSFSFSFGVATGSLATGTNEALTIGGYVYGSVNYFAAQTTLGPNKSQVGAPQGSSAGTDFTLNLEP